MQFFIYLSVCHVAVLNIKKYLFTFAFLNIDDLFFKTWFYLFLFLFP